MATLGGECSEGTSSEYDSGHRTRRKEGFKNGLRKGIEDGKQLGFMLGREYDLYLSNLKLFMESYGKFPRNEVNENTLRSLDGLLFQSHSIFDRVFPGEDSPEFEVCRAFVEAFRYDFYAKPKD